MGVIVRMSSAYAGPARVRRAAWEGSQRNSVCVPPETHCNGMHWVGETAKYFGVDMHVFRPRTADLGWAAPEGNHPPGIVD
jgi:hypothetical protein